MLLLQNNIIRNKQVDKKTFRLEFDSKSKKYKVKTICNSAVYTSKSEAHLPGLYYLVL